VNNDDYLPENGMKEEKNWNAVFAQRMEEHKQLRQQKLNQARTAAKNTGKEPFCQQKFKELYIRLNADSVDKFTPWDTLIKESEYDYYVTNPDLMTLEALVKHLQWLEGWG
jgi:hypothetical protein